MSWAENAGPDTVLLEIGFPRGTRRELVIRARHTGFVAAREGLSEVSRGARET
ncbi:hypothetical protein HanHA300_Chr04g0128741 [Helianthus annuus]|nr:hypothetical protein HanHA300_Chr04g0128741 [Helianthus annuus]KAJ0596354.1 hypothetical protein HanHA89_Chr04g0141791 [Helianthus annuus]KAJ0757011.1 hypothetical protein HanLR1_Chr04g0133641 [Helianthus annuus]